MKDMLSRILDTLTDAIVYDGQRPMAALVVARDAVRDAYHQEFEKPTRSAPRDYQLIVPGVTVRTPEPGQEHLPSWEQVVAYHHTDSTVVYMLDGRATTGKLFAIKYIRNRDGIGLKEAKDYVEGLPQVFAESRDLTQ